MDSARLAYEIKRLSMAERILLVEEIWDSTVSEQESLEITEAQKEELDRRFREYYDAPDEGVSWGEIKKRLTGRQ